MTFARRLWRCAASLVSGRAAGRSLLMVCAVLLGAVASVLGLYATPAVTRPVGPVTVHLDVTPSWQASSELALPPLGKITSSTHSSPLRLRASVSDLDLREASAYLTQGADVDRLLVQAREQALSAGVQLVAGATAMMLVFAVLVGLLLPGRGWRTVSAALSGAVLTAGVLAGWSAASFRSSEVSQVRLTGTLAQMPALLSTLSSGRGEQALASRVQALAAQLDAAYRLTALPPAQASGTRPDGSAGRSSQQGVSAESDALVSGGELVVLHVSDLHSNPLGVAFAAGLARTFDVDAVLDTGDLTSFGVSVESELLAGLEPLLEREVPYLFVPGNHDAPQLRERIAESGVTVLDGTVVTLGQGAEQVRIYGQGDPTFTADNRTSSAQASAAKRALASSMAASAALVSADVLAVHDPLLASQAPGRVPLVVAGHTHRRSLSVVDGTVLSTVGSTGALGLAAHADADDARFEAQLLRFRAGALVAVDYVSMDGVGGPFALDRQLIAPLRRAG